MKKGLLLTVIGGLLAAAGVKKMLKKEDIIDETDVIDFEDCEEEAEASEDSSEE